MAPPRRNVELKARDPEPERSLERCVALGAEDRGELRQRDTYFAARRGRLKLREQEPGAAELIAYERADAAEARESRYRIAPGGAPPAPAGGGSRRRCARRSTPRSAPSSSSTSAGGCSSGRACGSTSTGSRDW